MWQGDDFSGRNTTEVRRWETDCADIAFYHVLSPWKKRLQWTGSVAGLGCA
ncbi:hypothetical protein SY94_3549 [Agrobacterium tumefaciens]|nr:hypothetical protein SY94_3549 [Agrobacterium tumefaciens]